MLFLVIFLVPSLIKCVSLEEILFFWSFLVYSYRLARARLRHDFLCLQRSFVFLERTRISPRLDCGQAR